MNRAILINIAILATGLLGISYGQIPLITQVSPRPAPPPVTNQLRRERGYDPFQFNWSTGRWMYAPIPYQPAPLPHRFNWFSGRWEYWPSQLAPRVNPVLAEASDPAVSKAPPADSNLWTQSLNGRIRAVKTVQFKGRLIGVKAVDLSNQYHPDILLRLRNGKGKTATVDVGEQLKVPDGFDPQSLFKVNGDSGTIDDSPVIFANQILVGSQHLDIHRDHQLQEIED